jgi:hypothetical protein
MEQKVKKIAIFRVYGRSFYDKKNRRNTSYVRVQ